MSRPTPAALLAGSALLAAAVLTPNSPAIAHPATSQAQSQAHGRTQAQAPGRAAGQAHGRIGTAVASVSLPRHASAAMGLHLIGAGPAGYAVAQVDPGGSQKVRLLTGTAGGELDYRGDRTYRVAGVSGTMLGWASATGTGWTVNGLDLATGARTRATSRRDPVAWTPTGWIDWNPADRTLTRRTYTGGSSLLLTVPATGPNADPVVQADGTGVVVGYDAVVGGVRNRRVVVLNSATASPRLVADVPYAVDPVYGAYSLVGQVMLTPDTVSWISYTEAGVTEVNRQPRAGGTTSTVAASDPGYRGSFVAAGDRVAYFATANTSDDTTDTTPGQLVVLDGQAWSSTSLPGPASGLAAAGSAFVTAVSGTEAVAGVYAVTGAPTRVVSAAEAEPTATPVELSLSAGRLTYLDTGLDDDGSGSLWTRTVTVNPSGSELTLGPEGRLLPVPPATGPLAVRTGLQVLSTSAGRGVLEPLLARADGDVPYRLFDRGVVTRTVSAPDRQGYPVRASGPYALIERRVFRADGTLALDLSDERLLQADLYGPQVVYSTTDGRVRLRDLSAPVSAGNPRTLQGRRCARGCGGPVAIWGDTVAWTRPDSAIAVRTLPGTAVRLVRPTTHVVDLRLGEAGLSWRVPTELGSSLRIVDLAGGSTTYSIALDAAVVDDHLVAGLSPTSGRIVVRTLPFGLNRAYRPRLIGALAAASFTPASDGFWAPRFDLTKPVSQVTLTILRGSTAVRTLIGSAIDGSVRDLSWDGRDDEGAPAPAGTYSWQLTGTANDGDGAITAADGHATPTAPLTLTR